MNKYVGQKYVDAIKQNALSRRVLVAVAAARSAIGGGSMVHRLDFDLCLHRLAGTADGGGSGDYNKTITVHIWTSQVSGVSSSLK